MRWFKQVAAISLLMTLTLTEFTNCGGYSSAGNESLSSFACTSPNCVTPDATNLKITPILENTGTYYVNATVNAFNLGGVCNEGGFAANQVKWELLRNGVVVRSSDQPVAQTSSGWVPATTSCKNGRFSAYVNLGPDQSNTSFVPLTGGYQLRVTLLAIGSTAAGATATAIVTLATN